MSGILRLESLTKGNTLKQGDKTPLKYRLFDADGEKLNIAGKSAQVRLVYQDFLTIGYEKDGLTVAQDDTVTFTIDNVIPSRAYHVEIIVDDKFIFPSRADESKFTVDKSSLGTDANIIEIVGVDAVVKKAVDLINKDPNLIIDEDKLVGDIISNTGIGSIEEYYQQFSDVITELSEEKDYHSLPEIAGARRGYSTLAESLGNLSVNMINKNLGKLDQTYMTEEFLQQMAGDTPINTVPANHSVTPNKTTFFNFGKNLFNYKDITKGYAVDNLTGELVPNSSFNAFQFIPVEPNTIYTKSAAYSSAFYQSKSLSSYISGATTNSFTTPPNANYVSITTHKDVDLKSYMLVKGTTLGTYEPYIEPHIPINKIGEITDKSVGEEKLTFIEDSVNLYDAKSAEKGVYYTWNTGEKTASVDYTASDFMDTPPGVYQNNRDIRFVAFYNDSGDHVGGINALVKDAGFTVPPTATKTIVSVANIFADDLQITKGSTVQHFQAYGAKLKPDVVPSLVTPTTITLPDVLYGTVGTTLDIFFDNVIAGKAKNYDFSVNSTVGKTMSDRWTYSPTVAGINTIEIEAYQNGVMATKKTVTIIVSAIGTKDLTALVLGDSTVNANFMTQRLLDLYNQESGNLTLIGTRGSGSNRSEGRGGWGAKTYRTGASIYGAVNPFYNPAKSDFDFAYYMSNQGYSTPDHVIIQLGINDTFGFKSDGEVYTGISQIKTDLDFIINNIKAYSSAIKVGITVTIPPNCDQDVFGDVYGNAQTQWRYKRNNAIWTRWLIDTYQYRDAENIRLIPMHHNIDTTTDFRDAVHPKDTVEYGYGRMGDSIYSYLKRIG